MTRISEEAAGKNLRKGAIRRPAGIPGTAARLTFRSIVGSIRLWRGLRLLVTFNPRFWVCALGRESNVPHWCRRRAKGWERKSRLPRRATGFSRRCKKNFKMSSTLLADKEPNDPPGWNRFTRV